MDHTPSTAVPDCPTAADTCQCRPACCAHCGAGQPSEAALRHRRNLAEIGEMGMDLARRIHQQTQEMRVVGFQGANMFDQITRAVRRAHALEAKIEADGFKTAAQRAAELATLDAAVRRGEPSDRPVTAPDQEAKPRKRNKLLNDLRDPDDTMNDLDDLDDEDPDEGHAGATLDSIHKTVATAEKNLDAARAAAAGGGKAVAAAPVGSVAAQAERRVAFAIAGNKFRHTKLKLTPIPAALAWPPPMEAAHDPPR